MIYIHMMDRFNRFRKGQPHSSRSYFAVSWGAPLICWLADRFPKAFHAIMDDDGYYLHLSPEHEHPERYRAATKHRKRQRKGCKEVSPFYIWMALTNTKNS